MKEEIPPRSSTEDYLKLFIAPLGSFAMLWNAVSG